MQPEQHHHPSRLHHKVGRPGAQRFDGQEQGDAQDTFVVMDWNDVLPADQCDYVMGNPPYIRYQDFTGESRAKALRAALRDGVRLNGLASSWAAFVVHASAFLKPGGRLALVLPAELLIVACCTCTGYRPAMGGNRRPLDVKSVNEGSQRRPRMISDQAAKYGFGMRKVRVTLQAGSLQSNEKTRRA